jgi:hypothetical protein
MPGWARTRAAHVPCAAAAHPAYTGHRLFTASCSGEIVKRASARSPMPSSAGTFSAPLHFCPLHALAGELGA